MSNYNKTNMKDKNTLEILKTGLKSEIKAQISAGGRKGSVQTGKHKNLFLQDIFFQITVLKPSIT